MIFSKMKFCQQSFFTVKLPLLTVPSRCFFCESFLLLMFRVCHAFLSLHCSLVVTCWERANLLALLYVLFSCVFVTFPGSVLSHVWYNIVSIPDLCLLSNFKNFMIVESVFLIKRSKDVNFE